MSTRSGFTLVEVMIVVVIIGILALLALPRFSNSIEKGADSAAVTDLRNAMTAQETYLIDFQTYTLLSNLGMSTTQGVILGGGGSAGGYTLTARHQSSNATYEVTVGNDSGAEGKIVKR